MSSSRRYLLAFVVFLSALCRQSLSSSSSSSINATDNVVDVVADELLRECWSSASFSCVQNGLRRAIDTSLSSDMDVTDSVRFVSNGYKYSEEANRDDYVDDDDEMNTIDVNGSSSTKDDDHFDDFVRAVEASEAIEDGRSINDEQSTTDEPHTHVSGIADILYNRGVRYLMTHDLNLDLPEYGFGGGRIRIQPKSFDDDGGVLIKLNFDEPKTTTTTTTSSAEKGRFFLKRIRQIFKKKLMTSFMAAMLIIKLIKVKMMFLLPVIVGVTTAKKILLKVLLFLFPALTHLFKLCAYYHHHHTKLSHHFHHHHGVNHHVHHPPPVYGPPPSYEYDHPPPGATIIHRSEDVLSQWGINYEEPSNENERIFTQPQTPVAAASVAYPTNQHSYAPPPTIHQPQRSPVYPQNNEDPFYSPILDKLDRVFSELGFNDEPCKERLVCSMYKAPARFSPHSNLVSAEISRDPSELQKPVIQTPGVLRYFRYVAAARNGQDAKDCLSLYPHCSLLTE